MQTALKQVLKFNASNLGYKIRGPDCHSLAEIFGYKMILFF